MASVGDLDGGGSLRGDVGDARHVFGEAILLVAFEGLVALGAGGPGVESVSDGHGQEKKDFAETLMGDGMRAAPADRGKFRTKGEKRRANGEN